MYTVKRASRDRVCSFSRHGFRTLSFGDLSQRTHFSSLVAVCSAKGDFSMKRRTKGDQFSEKGLLGDLGLLKETQERSLEQGVQPNIFEGGLAGMAWRFVYIPIYE